MPRLARRIAACLLLGLLTTIATSFALALWMPFEIPLRHRSHYFLRDSRPWRAIERSSRGVHLIWWVHLGSSDTIDPTADPERSISAAEHVELAIREHKEVFADNPLNPPSFRTPPRWGTFSTTIAPSAEIGADHGFGWPFPALWYRVNGRHVSSPTFGYAVQATTIDGAHLISDPDQLSVRGTTDHRALPYLPHYPGLLANSALFAALWALLLFTPPYLRRTLRLRRGHCPACGYDLAATQSPTCPECGRHK